MKHLFLIPLLLITMLMASCSDSPADTPVEPVRRTILVYMLADNSLGRSGRHIADINEMKEAAAGGLGDCRLLVYCASTGTDNGNAPRLLEITGEGEKVLLTYPDDPSVFSVESRRMREVIADSRRLAPAGEYGLVLWSHGTGWREDNGSLTTDDDTATQRTPAADKRSFGDDRGRKMSIPYLASALNGLDFSFIYFDCCLMSTVEVAYELRHAAPVIIASGTELPADGMPYHLTVPVMTAPGDIDFSRLAATTFNHYDNLVGQARTCTMTVIDTRALDRLAAATKAIMLTGPSLYVNFNAMQSYDMAAVSTIYDMKLYIHTIAADTALLDQWDAAYDDAVEYAAATPYVLNYLKINYYSGLGCHIATGIADAGYMGYTSLAWWRDVMAFHPSLAAAAR